jgi:hypothetical protein
MPKVEQCVVGTLLSAPTALPMGYEGFQAIPLGYLGTGRCFRHATTGYITRSGHVQPRERMRAG